MTEFEEFEELEKRKKDLQLRHDIAELERSARIHGAASKVMSLDWFRGLEVSRFFHSTFKGAISLIFAAVALSVVSGIVWAGYAIWNKHEAAQYEVLREWPVDLTNNLQMNLLARTKLVDGKLLMDVKLDGYPGYLIEPRLKVRNNEKNITLTFQDKDGFAIYSKAIEIGWFSSLLDAKGANAGLRYAFDVPYSLADYERFAKLDIGWTLDTSLPETTSPISLVNAPMAPAANTSMPATSSPIPPTEIQSADHCAPDLSREERLKRLSQYGEVRQTGERAYSVGLKSLAFYYDDSLMKCQ